MSQALSLISRLIGCRRPAGPDWWSYFGSFGDDIFEDDHAELLA
jgi:hypothetical protein